MRPIVLHSHERPLNQVKYNRDGDLVLSVSNDKVASVWYSHNGERLGTLTGHNGAIKSIDISWDSRLIVTGSADFSMKFWNAQNGKCLKTINLDTPALRVEINPESTKLLLITDGVMGFKGSLQVFEINVDEILEQESEYDLKTLWKIDNSGSSDEKFSVAGWSYASKYIIAGHEHGLVSKIDGETGEILDSVQAHEKLIKDIQFNLEDRTYFVTSSKDKSARLIDVDELKIMKTYYSSAPVNSATITPVKNFIILGGGQDAKDVTTTSAREGNFEAKIFHKIFEDEIGKIRGHFGPMNCIAIHPQGTGFTSGGEEGLVRINHFDKNYFDFQYDVERTADL